jgi:hypothetical protein
MGLGTDDLEKYHDRGRNYEHQLVQIVSLLHKTLMLILREAR